MLTCDFVKPTFRVSRIPCPKNCPVGVPYTLHTELSRNPWDTRRLTPMSGLTWISAVGATFQGTKDFS